MADLVTELDVALDVEDRRIWAELGFDDETAGPVVDVPVRRRQTPPTRVRITAKPRPAATSNVITIDERTYSERWHAGELLPGTYRLVDDLWRDESGQLKWQQTVTVPSRIPAWVRSGQGRLWHRVRWAEIVWATRVLFEDVPRLRVTTWCGPYFSARRAVPPPLLSAVPTGRVCTKCDPTVPDRRRLPDLLEELHRD